MSLLSCTKEKGTIYTVDFSSRDFPQKSVDLDEYVDSWRKVILETDSLCLVDKAAHFYPCKKNIIVYSPNKIMMFDITVPLKSKMVLWNIWNLVSCRGFSSERTWIHSFASD